MDYQTALKEVMSSPKMEDNYISFVFDYSKQYVLPHKDGLAVIAALNKAEILETKWGDETPLVYNISSNHVQISQLSAEEFRQYKMAQLLNVSLKEIKEMAIQNQ